MQTPNLEHRSGSQLLKLSYLRQHSDFQQMIDKSDLLKYIKDEEILVATTLLR
jgi:hypothetical protein